MSLEIKTINGVKMKRVIPVYSAKPWPKSKYEGRKDGDMIKARRLRQIVSGAINVS